MGISKGTFPWAGAVPFSTHGCGGSRRTRGSKKAQRQTTFKKYFLARRDADFVRRTQISSIKLRYSSVLSKTLISDVGDCWLKQSTSLWEPMLHKYEGLALHFSRDRRRMLIARVDVHSRQAVLTNRGSDRLPTVLSKEREKKEKRFIYKRKRRWNRRKMQTDLQADLISTVRRLTRPSWFIALSIVSFFLFKLSQSPP